MIDFDDVTITYPDATGPTLSRVNLHVDEGELCLVVGVTGTGKSTLLGAVNGLVPHFTGGRLAGRVTVAGADTRTHRPRDLAHIVGMVGQDPLAGFVTDSVEEELAYVMEQLAVAPSVMRKRVEETLDLLGLADLRHRPLRTLSGGQQQRVAIGAALTAHPQVLVLDEPTSALDPTAAEEVLAAVTRLVHDLGLTVLIAEHRLERVIQYADRLVVVTDDGSVRSGDPDELLAISPVAPPVVRLGRLAGWTPLPRSVRDARRQAGPLRDRLAAIAPPAGPSPPRPGPPAPAPAPTGASTEPPVLRAVGVAVRYGSRPAVQDVCLDLVRGQVVALMGRNGSGKSSLLWALQGTGPRAAGTITVDGHDPARLSPYDARHRVGLVPQTAGDLLFRPTVADECRQADRESSAEAGSCRALLDQIAPGVPPAAHPADLSEGQRLALVLAIQLTSAPAVMLLDEPTRGLDYAAKDRLREVIRTMAAAHHAVVVATHDVEFVAEVADRVVVMADGDVVADGRTADVIVSSPAFAPQVAKILAPQRWLTVEQVSQALAGES